MKCEDFKNLLDDYIDGELSEEKMRELEGHADTCAECASALKSAKLLNSMFRDTVPSIELPDEARQLLYERVRAEKRKSKRNMYLRILSTAAALFVLFTGVTAIIRNNDGSTGSNEIDQIREYDFVASDGAASVAYDEEISENASLSLKSKDGEAAAGAVATLASQFEGSADVTDTGVTVTIPADSVDDFIDELSAAGDLENSEDIETGGDTAVIDIIIEQE